MDIIGQIPKWQMELLSFKGIKSTFIIEGNIHDVYPVITQEGEQYALDNSNFSSINLLIPSVFNTGETSGFYEFLYCDPLSGFSDPLYNDQVAAMVRRFEKKLDEEQKGIEKINGGQKTSGAAKEPMVVNTELMRISMTTQTEENREARKSIVNIVNCASRFLDSPDHMDEDDIAFFLNLQKACENAIRGNRYINTLILVVDKLNDVPAWFYFNSPHVRVITVPNPDRNTRLAFIKQRSGSIFSEGIDAEKAEGIKNKFADLTAGMKLLEILELLRLREKNGIAIENISDVITVYKYGFKDNKWAQIREKLVKEDIHSKVEERVKGQAQAIDKIVRVIKRSVVGLSGLQHSSGTKPRGILFLAGPTGTGKTEVVKAVTELLFGDEKSLIRFDMSEYAVDNADQKLFGAPPGYVGYDNGGQLTNAVKSNPFSVLLFDEIEKAHPSIMDKFLQILEDGRMTDGQGNTVYFTETLIFFTSNVGISQETVDPATGRVVGRKSIVLPGEDYEVIRDKVEEAMKTHFKPEVINRIGENIVVFNYIGAEASKAIARSQISRINENILKDSKITVVMEGDAPHQLLYDLCQNEKTQANGGRGIGNVIEEQYLNPLAECIFDSNCAENDTVIVKRADNDMLVFMKG